MSQASDSPNLRVLGTAQEAADACTSYVLSLLSGALAAQSRTTIAISGGSTPKPLFAALAKADFDWRRVHFFWVDERCVPPTDSQSNFKLANDGLLTPARIPSNNIHRVYGELPPEAAAARYNSDIQTFFSLTAGELPAFDVLHRGMGPDAHTASLFPGESLINDKIGIAANVWVEKMQMHRITLLPGVLLAAKNTILQVSGDDKADALAHVLRGPEDWLHYPCQIASRDKQATWFLDRAAAKKL
jgi:6-phosphogluconolactonase